MMSYSEFAICCSVGLSSGLTVGLIHRALLFAVRSLFSIARSGVNPKE